ncbi:MAG: type II and III secretion system protein [Planctomycetaceae bacterium]
MRISRLNSDRFRSCRLGMIAVLLCAGCHGPGLRRVARQTDHPRSLDQLYFEAIGARPNYPENTHTPHEGTVLSDGPTLDGFLTGASAPATEPAAFPQAASTPPTLPPTPGGSNRVTPVEWQQTAAPGIVPAAASSDRAAGSDVRVTEIFEDTDIRQAIQALATQAGASVIIDERVAGITTAFIEDEPFELALRKVLLPLGLISRVHDGQYLIGSADPDSALFPLLAETSEYKPRHMSPQELLPMLPERLQGYVRLVVKRNLMVIEAPPEMAARIIEQLQRVDQPVPQVVLEAIVCVYNPNQEFTFSNELRQALNVDGNEVLNLGTLGLAATGVFSPFGLQNAFNDFARTSMFLRLLAQEGYITIRAAPRVMAKDGEKATISISRETFFALQPSSANLLFRQDVQKVDAGIVLDIVPVIRGNSVTVTIEKAEVSEDVRGTDQNDTLTSQFPLINRRQVSTTVHVQDGQTIVIGGLTQRQTIDRFSKVPYLHRVPWLGKMFERIEQEDESVDVAIFISPKIIRPLVCDESCPVDVGRGFSEEPRTAGPTLIPPSTLPPPMPVSEPPMPSSQPTARPQPAVDSSLPGSLRQRQQLPRHRPNPARPHTGCAHAGRTTGDARTIVHQRQQSARPAGTSAAQVRHAPPGRFITNCCPVVASRSNRSNSRKGITRPPRFDVAAGTPLVLNRLHGRADDHRAASAQVTNRDGIEDSPLPV